MSFLASGLVRVVGGAETAVHYLVGKLPFVTASTVKVTRDCVGTIVTSKTDLLRPELAGEEIYKFFKPALAYISEACMSDTFCARAASRSFLPIVTPVANSLIWATEKTSNFAVEQLKDWPILSNVAEGANEIVRWAIRDGFKEGAGLQTLLSLGVIKITTIAPIVQIVSYHKQRPHHKTWQKATFIYLTAGLIGFIALKELLSLYNRARMENSCLG